MNQPRTKRRLAAILAADVVGYSRLMGEDETGTLAQLKTLRKEVFDPRTAEHNGRIVKTTGDGVLVEFASAVDATECAIKIQRVLLGAMKTCPKDTASSFGLVSTSATSSWMGTIFTATA